MCCLAWLPIFPRYSAVYGIFGYPDADFLRNGDCVSFNTHCKFLLKKCLSFIYKSFRLKAGKRLLKILYIPEKIRRISIRKFPRAGVLATVIVVLAALGGFLLAVIPRCLKPCLTFQHLKRKHGNGRKLGSKQFKTIRSSRNVNKLF